MDKIEVDKDFLMKVLQLVEDLKKRIELLEARKGEEVSVKKKLEDIKNRLEKENKKKDIFQAFAIYSGKIPKEAMDEFYFNLEKLMREYKVIDVVGRIYGKL